MRGSWHGNKYNIGVIHPLFGACRKVETLGGHIAMDQVLKAGLIDWHFTGEQLLDFFLVVVHAGDRVTDFSEAGTRNQSDVSRTNNAEFHVLFLCFCEKSINRPGGLTRWARTKAKRQADLWRVLESHH